MRPRLKRLAESALVWSGAASVSRRGRRSRSLILAYHDIVPNGTEPAGDGSLHLGQTRFAAQLDALARTHDIVPLRAIIDGPAGTGRRPRAAITFDDAYHGAVTAGVAELARRGLPATIFVPPGLLGGQQFWWDVLSAPASGALDPTIRAHALSDLAGQGDRILEDAARVGAPRHTLPPHVRSATEEELGRAAAVPGIALGAHTWSHPNLAALDAAELDAELGGPLVWLRQRFEGVLPYLTYPYGLYTLAVQRAARAAGYSAALRIDGGWVPSSGVDPFAVPRLDVPAGVSADGFHLRAAGLVS